MIWSTHKGHRITREEHMWYKTKKFFKDLYEWHKDACYQFQYKLNLSDYAMWWVTFLEGVFLTLFFMWLF